MIEYENRCVGCSDGLRCQGSICPNRNVKVYVCDACDEDATLYEFEGEQLCIDCIKERLERVR